MREPKFTSISFNNGERKMTFDTVKEAAERFSVTRNNVYSAIRNGYKVRGYEVAAKEWNNDIEYREDNHCPDDKNISNK